MQKSCFLVRNCACYLIFIGLIAVGLDGGLYVGEVTNGVITGKGEYQSAFGEIYRGTFLNGLLHGEGTYINYSGEEFSGMWRHGEMNFYGSYKNRFGDWYKGEFKHSTFHGRGHLKYKSLGEYKGFWCNGTRTGKAEMDFLARSETTKEEDLTELQARSGHEFKYRYQGYFHADRIINGGIQMDTVVQAPYAISGRDKVNQSKLQRFENRVADSLKKISRKNSKLKDIEYYMRNEIEIKKYRIFKQQRHYTKTAMYEEDTEGMNRHELIERKNARESNLQRLDDRTLKSSHARVPRLQIIDPSPTTHLNKALRSIEANRIERIEDFDDYQLDKIYLQKLTISNFEEAIERQRFLKYDRIWGRAEQKYTEKKKKAAEAAAQLQQQVESANL
jgi:hypothetical protein